MKTLHKVLDILETFLSRKEEYSISELSQITGLNVATVHRICSTLTERGYLHQYANRGKYSLGLKMTEYNFLEILTLRVKEVAKPYMEALSRDISETVSLAFLTSNDRIKHYFVYSENPLQVLVEDKEKTPLHCTGIGKVFLASMSDEKIESIFRNIGFKKYTQNTITDLDKMKKELQSIQKKGVSLDEQEYDLGVRNVAAPIKDSNGKVIAVVSVVGPTVRISKKKMKEVIPHIKTCASKISEALDITKNGAPETMARRQKAEGTKGQRRKGTEF